MLQYILKLARQEPAEARVIESALQFEEINLSRFLLIWFQRLQEVSQLEDQAEDLLAQTNFNLLRNAVHKWSMLYNKTSSDINNCVRIL